MSAVINCETTKYIKNLFLDVGHQKDQKIDGELKLIHKMDVDMTSY